MTPQGTLGTIGALLVAMTGGRGILLAPRGQGPGMPLDTDRGAPEAGGSSLSGDVERSIVQPPLLQKRWFPDGQARLPPCLLLPGERGACRGVCGAAGVAQSKPPPDAPRATGLAHDTPCPPPRPSEGQEEPDRTNPECERSRGPLITHLDSVPQVLPEHKRLLDGPLSFLTVLLTSTTRLIFLRLFLLETQTGQLKRSGS